MLSIICLLITVGLVNRRKEQEKMLIKYYKPYSRKRIIALIELLRKYNINYEDIDKISLLIEQADIAKEKFDIFSKIKSSFNAVAGYVLAPLPTIILTQIIGKAEGEALYILAIQIVLVVIMIFVLGMSLKAIISELFGKENIKYEDLKNDLQQIVIFGRGIEYDTII